RNPRVGSLSSLNLRTGPHVTADIACGQPYGAEDADHDVSEILADAPAMAHDIRQWNVDGCRFRMVFEILVNAVCQLLNGLEQRPLRRERLPCVLGKLGHGRNER